MSKPANELANDGTVELLLQRDRAWGDLLVTAMDAPACAAHTSS
jgi:hypothetical protein